MKVIRRVVLLAALIMCAQAGFSLKARAEITDVRGRWTGLLQLSPPSPPAGPIPIPYPVTLDISSQDQRRFFGEVFLPAVQFPNGPTEIFIEGTISANDILNLTGHSGGVNFELNGKTRLMGDGSVRLAGARFILDGTRSHDNGIMIFIQQQGGADWGQPGPVPDVTGHWMGDYQPSVGPGGGCIEMDLIQQRLGGGIDQLGFLTSAFRGTLHMENVYLPAVQRSLDLNFDALGTVGLPAVQRNGDTGAPFGLIGLLQPPPNLETQHGIIAILIGLLLPAVQDQLPAVQGNYKLYNSLTDVFDELFHGFDSSFQGGGFLVTEGGIIE